jgi:V8-like Glu-specific endopeptidase
MALDDYPIDYTSAGVRALLAILGETYFRSTDIIKVLQDAGLPLDEVNLDGRASAVWRSALDAAASQGEVVKLIDTVKADKPALKVRLEELGQTADAPVDSPPPQGAVAFDSGAWKNFSYDGQAEAVIVAGQPTFVDVSFLAVGIERAKSVCRLATHFPGEGSGTAFRIGPRHLLTNHHVLFNHDKRVTAVEAWFDYQTDEKGKLVAGFPQLSCDVSSIKGEKDEDWAVVETSEAIPDHYPILSLEDGPAPDVDDRVYIIQHPYGLPKKVAFQHNLVRAVLDDRFQYWTDTDIGSSGSPVFDEQWRVVGLHHFSVKAPEADRISVRNQGRRIDRVVARMRDLNAMPGV